MKKAFVDVLLWCLLCVLVVAGFFLASAIGRYPRVSLRFDTPISGQTAYSARRYSVSHGGESVFWPTFWHEHRAAFSGEFVSLTADSIAYSGDAHLVWPAEYIAGAAPGIMDGDGCAVSQALALRLWGSIDILGMTVEVDGVERIVRGVFKGKDELALISFRDEDTSQSWSAAELTGGPDGAVRADAESYASASGLGRPDSILMGGHNRVAGFLAAMPLIILAVYGAALIAGFIKKSWPAARRPVLFLVIILLAVASPILIGALPAWMIPTRWSDFTFWSSLLGRASDGLREFLGTAPRLRDVELRMLLVYQTVIAFAAACAAVAACLRWRPKT